MQHGRILLAAVTLTILGALVPLGTAQTYATPVEGCSAECRPRDVNLDAPRTGAEPLNVILYGHFEDILNSAPLNTQAPDPVLEPDVNRGFLMPVIDTSSGACAAGECVDFNFKNNHFVMFSSGGLVEYMAGGWRTNQHPAIAYDVPLWNRQIVLYWYMSADATPDHGALGSVTDAGVMPQVGVYARVETGRFPGRGEVIAESSDFDEDGIGSGSRANLISLPGGENVYEFRVPLAVEDHVQAIPKDENGFIVTVNPYQIKGEGAQVAQADWRVHSGARFPPRIIFETNEPMTSVGSDVRDFRGELYLRWSLAARLGAYDIDDSTLRVDAAGPTNLADKLDLVVIRRFWDCDGATKPVNVTWSLNYTQHTLADGRYVVKASIMNLQHTYRLEQVFEFDVVNGTPAMHEPDFWGGAATVPSPGLPGLFLVGVAAVVFWRRAGRG